MQRIRSARGFTLVEMITSVFIIGLIVLLLGYEFDASITHLLHTQSNRDVQANARVIMDKLRNHLHAAAPDVNAVGNDCPKVGDSICILVSPTTNTPTNVLTFYRARPGSLSAPGSIPTCPSPNGVPCPAYDKVTIQCKTGCSPATPDQLIETAVDAVTRAPVIGEPPLTLGSDVTNFSVLNATSLGGSIQQDVGQIQISLQVASNNPRCSPTCTFDISDIVWVGGSTLENQ